MSPKLEAARVLCGAESDSAIQAALAAAEASAVVIAADPLDATVHELTASGWTDYMAMFPSNTDCMPPGMYQGARLPRNHMKNKREAMRRRRRK